jgi:hypothetical protein
MNKYQYGKELDDKLIKEAWPRIDKPESHDCTLSAEDGCEGCLAIAEALNEVAGAGGKSAS